MKNYSTGKSCNGSTVITGNSVDINLKDEVLCKSAEIRSDIVVEEVNAKRVWGQVKNCNGEPVANSMVKLVKIVCDPCGNKEFYGIAHTITNCEGFYQFDICADDLSCYKIIVNKATIGIEAIMMNGGGNCNLCTGDGNGNGNGGGYNPCKPTEDYYVDPTPCDCNYTDPCWCEREPVCDPCDKGNNCNKPGNGNKQILVDNRVICR